MNAMKLIFSLITLACSGSLVAQFDALPSAHAQWQTNLYEGPNFVEEYLYWIDDFPDTLVAGNIYMKLNNSQFLLFDNEIGQVYVRDQSGEESILYDFDVEPGDTVFDVYISEVAHINMYVNAVDTISVGSSMRKRIDIRSADEWGAPGYFYWIQGIGGTGGLLSTKGYFDLSGATQLYCMSWNDTVQFNLYGLGEGQPGSCFTITGVEQPLNEVAVVANPNPSMGHFILGTALKANVVTVYTSTGQQLFQTTGQEIDLSAYPPGLYHAVVRTAQGVGHVRLMVLR